MPATPELTESLTQRLHSVFDHQVTNYGAYNLIYASGNAEHTDGAVVEKQSIGQVHFIVGYRRAPSELVIAPFDPLSMEPTGLPCPIDNTNTVRMEKVSSGTVIVENTSGSRFTLEARALTFLKTAQGGEVLEQEHDVADFLDFADSATK